MPTRRDRRVVRLAISAAALGTVAATAACGGSSGPSAAPAGPTGPPAATATPTSPATTSAPGATGSTAPPPVGPTTAPAGPALCPTRSLSVRTGSSQGAAGSIYTELVFTNTSRVTCTLYGYPGVSLTTNASGHPVQVGAPAGRSTRSARKPVPLAPGAVAHALLQQAHPENFPASTCGSVVPADHLRIYPPNQTAPIYLTYTATACSKPLATMSIDVVQPGPGE